AWERDGYVEDSQVARHRDRHGAAHRKGAWLKEHAAARDAARGRPRPMLGMRVKMRRPPRGDFRILKISFGPCSKNLAENRFWRRLHSASMAPPSPTDCARHWPRNPERHDG